MGNFGDSVSLAAFIISLVALFATFAQAAQQYITTASEGYRRCQRSVMGRWADATQRRFKYRELRFEVVFHTPVLFLARPTNKRGPIPGREIYRIDGTADSYRDTLTVPPKEENSYFVHTTDDEKAGWVTLLESLQKAERESKAWDAKRGMTPRGEKHYQEEQSIYTFVQRKTRSWDFMPLDATRPFATTTLCHLIEMAGMLGIYWKTFDVTRGELTAEGNGYTFSSTQLRGLGLMVNFSIMGFSIFEAKRVIPNYTMKDYVFGSVPSILKDKEGGTRLLQVSTVQSVQRLLATFAMDAQGLQLYADKRMRRNVCSVTFELIAMLAEPVRLRGSMFRMLPNPTSDTWHGDESKVSWVLAIDTFQNLLSEVIVTAPVDLGPHQLLVSIEEHWKHVIEWTDCKDSAIDIDMKERVHEGLSSATEFLQDQSQVSNDEIIGVVRDHIAAVLEASADIEEKLTVLGVNASYVFIKYYFDEIRPKVVNGHANATIIEKRQREAIWVALVYRMICWFLLHDFDKADINIVPSVLKGSRMPVFIG